MRSLTTAAGPGHGDAWRRRIQDPRGYTHREVPAPVPAERTGPRSAPDTRAEKNSRNEGTKQPDPTSNQSSGTEKYISWCQDPIPPTVSTPHPRPSAPRSSVVEPATPENVELNVDAGQVTSAWTAPSSGLPLRRYEGRVRAASGTNERLACPRAGDNESCYLQPSRDPRIDRSTPIQADSSRHATTPPSRSPAKGTPTALGCRASETALPCRLPLSSDSRATRPAIRHPGNHSRRGTNRAEKITQRGNQTARLDV